MVSNSMKARPASKIRPMSAPVASSALVATTSSTVLDMAFPLLSRSDFSRAPRSDGESLARVDTRAGPEARGQHGEGSFGVRRLELEERPVVARGAGAEQPERSPQVRGRLLLPLPLEELALL